MNVSPATLQAIGLFIDVIGAFVIDAPDIPIVRDHVYSGKLSQGMSSLKSGNLTPQSTGFNQIVREIEDFAGEELPEGLNRVYIGHNTINVGGRSPWVIFAEYGPKNDNERTDYLDGEFKDLEEHLHNEIDSHESKLRGFGFITLYAGFMTQIVAIV